MTTKYKRIFDKKIEKYGQSATLYIYSSEERCPCFDESSGYGDPEWHRNNSKAPECNDEGYLKGTTEETKLKAFIFPATSLTSKGFEEIVLSTIGKVNKDDYVYVGKSDIDIFNLKETDYLVYENRRWKIKNPDIYKIGDTSLTHVAQLELIGSVSDD